MSPENLPKLIQAMLDPSFYPHEAAEVLLVQTHISFVLLAGAYVYKVKKPVDFGFLNFTTLEKREHFCREELLLNRRLCPSLYLEVLAIHQQGENFSLKGPGAPVEYCLKMARMPEDKMMPKVIKAGELDKPKLARIVEILVQFYNKAAGDSEIQAFGTAESVAVNVLENFEQTRSFIGCEALQQGQFDTITAYAHDFLQKESLFQERIAAQKIRDCHGDLYSANICLADQIYIFDCIEFNQRFRYCDVASDVAFLAMDLDYQGLANLSDYFIERFMAASNDPGLKKMLNFYKCYRAYVRGKIGLFTAHSPEVDEGTKKTCLEQAQKYFLLAERYAEAK
jgi:aminoglycoside phosphotransferase family enzyme